jgi:hypothetical protein
VQSEHVISRYMSWLLLGNYRRQEQLRGENKRSI